MKDNFIDVLLIPIAFILNYFFASIGFALLSFTSSIIASLGQEGSDFDHLMYKLEILSYEGITFLFFSYFFVIDSKTLITRSQESKEKSKKLEGLSSKGKKIINMAHNLFQKLPFEYSILTMIQIYLYRWFIIMLLMTILYSYKVWLIGHTVVPATTMLITITIFFGAAFLYLFDTKIGKAIAESFNKFVNRFDPDRIGDLEKKSIAFLKNKNAIKEKVGL